MRMIQTVSAGFGILLFNFFAAFFDILSVLVFAFVDMMFTLFSDVPIGTRHDLIHIFKSIECCLGHISPIFRISFGDGPDVCDSC